MSDFQTPDWVGKYMVSLLPANVKRVLEPTPGEGNLVRILTENGYTVESPSDFDSTGWKSPPYDAVIMNPPFTPMGRGYDILRLCMDMSDVVIALMPWLAIINSEGRTGHFLEYGLASVTHLPRVAFPGSRVQCCILELKRGYFGSTSLFFLERTGKIHNTQSGLFP